MAAQLTQAGTITREQTFLPIRRFPVAASTTIAKGDLLYIDTNGNANKSTTATDFDYVTKVVALGAADNGSGIARAIDVPCAVRNHFVTVVAGGAIKSGQRVKAAGSGKEGEVIASLGTSADANREIGIYWAKEGGTIAKGASSPFLESFTDTENWSQADAADNDIIEVQLF